MTPRSRSCWAPACLASRRASASISMPAAASRAASARARAAQGDGRVRQHRRVRVAVPHAGEARERLREHVVQAVAGRVDDVAGQQRAERERVAVRRRGPGGAPPHARRAWARGRPRRQRALDRVAERVGRRGGALGLGLRGAERGVVDDDPGRTRGVAGSTPRAWRWPRVISARAKRRRDRGGLARRGRRRAPWRRRRRARRRARRAGRRRPRRAGRRRPRRRGPAGT